MSSSTVGDEGQDAAEAAAIRALAPGTSGTFDGAGGKGANLAQLSAAGLPVPRWAIIPAGAQERFYRDNALDRPIAEALGHLDQHNVAHVAEQIQRLFAVGEYDQAILDVIADAYELAGSGVVAIRSSGGNEDSFSASFAGQYETFLNVSGLGQIRDCVRSCWASAYSERLLHYCLARGVRPEVIPMAVIVQTMVAAEKSGVIFTVNPVTRRADELLLSAAYGLGEGVVGGRVDADTLTLSRATGTVKEIVVGAKAERIEPAENGGVRAIAVADEDRAALVLTQREISELADCAREIEHLFGCPQDIEWAIGPDGLTVLQSRPVTSTVDAAPGAYRIWDNSNIIESFGEVTASLTYTFARWAYRCVFADHARLIGVPACDRQEIEQWLANMLGYFNGRVYYNLLNWYRLVGLLPLYGPHRRILEVSLGVNESIDDELARALRPLRRARRSSELLVRMRIALRFVWHFATIELSVKRFLHDFHRLYEQFDPIDYSLLSSEEVYVHYRDAEASLLTRWGRMVVLEAVLALSFGAMHALTQRWLPDAPNALVWEMAKVDSDVESAAPIARLHEIAQVIRSDQQLSALFARLPYGSEHGELRRTTGAKAQALRAAIDRYIDDFGYRNANELKLEEPDLREAPALLFGMIRGALAKLDRDSQLAAREASGEGGESYLTAHLHGPRLWVYKLVRRRVRRALRARESVRFCRTRTFGVARRMFRAIGEDFARIGALEDARDVFHLRLEELLGAFTGTIAHRELKPLVALRKQLEAEYQAECAPARFTTSGTVYWGGLQAAWTAGEQASEWDGTALYGVPCAPGVAEGPARVISRPIDAERGIIVTYRTDPGWVSALALADGLVIERGSPLTHVAVVARELGIPTVIQVPRVTERVCNGERLRVDGALGTVTIKAATRETT